MLSSTKLLLTVCLVALVQITTIVQAAGLKRDKLLLVVENFKNGKAPNPEDVVAAYREFVDLHSEQSNLAKSYEDAQNSARENEYERVTETLNSHMVQLVHQYFFSLISDDTYDGRVSLTPELRQKIMQASKSLELK